MSTNTAWLDEVKWTADGLVPALAQDHKTGQVLMMAWMNREALEATVKEGRAIYYSRSRQKLWKKGETSGLVQHVKELLIDDDQDAIWMRVEVDGGASCHVGYKSCFYRKIPVGDEAKNIAADKPVEMSFTEHEKAFDPKAVYGDAPNPTKL